MTDRSTHGGARERVTPAQARSFGRALRAWYRAHKRPLPWRETRDPYAIWISEVMLQQTGAAVAAPRWRRFLARFPDAAALAAAAEPEVLAEWSGLGYYARARNLRRAAALVAARGAFPRSVEELAALPGVGRYTAAAVASIAFDVKAAAVDGNVVRVLARVLGLEVEAGSPEAIAQATAHARALVPEVGAGEHNQALMELGATVCTPRSPRCAECPLRKRCRAAESADPERFPRPRVRRAPRSLRLAAGFALRGDALVLTEDRDLVRGHWIVPLAPLAPDEDAAARLRAEWPGIAGRRVRGVTALATLRHSVLERRYVIELFRVVEGTRAAGRGESGASSRAARAVPLEELARLPSGGLLAKVLAAALADPAHRAG